MSGISTSLTLAVPRQAAAVLLNAWEKKDDLSALDPYYSDGACLHATSRNSHLENIIRRVLQEFKEERLSYLGRSSIILQEGALSEAIAGLQALIGSIQTQPALCASTLNGYLTSGYMADDVLKSLTRPPTSPGEAIHRFRESGSGDADDLPSFVAFLYAHLAILEVAQANNLSGLYLLWLY